MALRLPPLRHALRHACLHPRLPQRRWAQVHSVRFHATHDTHARILARYQSKLEAKAKAQGLSDLDQLKEQYKDKIQELRNQAIVPGATGPLVPPPSPTTPSPSTTSHTPPKSPWPSPPPPPTPQSGDSPPGLKTLSSFLNLSKIQSLPSEEVQALWRLRHVSNPQSLHFALPASTFSTLLHTATQHPSFVLPLPREIPGDTHEPPTTTDSNSSSAEPANSTTQQAVELHYLQFSHPHPTTTTLLFTTLAEFKLRGEFAAPHTTISFHRELAQTHDLVLGQGIVVENRGVSVDDARWLVMCMQKFYVQGEQAPGRRELLNMFTQGNTGFQVERLVEEAERVV